MQKVTKVLTSVICIVFIEVNGRGEYFHIIHANKSKTEIVLKPLPST